MSITLSPPQSATSFLVPPTADSSGRIANVREEAGFTLGTIDSVVQWLAGFSPIEEWVAKPLAGDWSSLDRGAVAWRSAGQAVNAVAENLKYIPDAIGDSWQGEAADAFDKAQAKVSEQLAPIPGACDSMAELCTALADMAEAITGFVLAIAVALAEFIAELTAALSSVVGSVTLPAWVTKLGVNLAKWVPKLTSMIQKFLAMATKVATFVKKFQEVFKKLWAIVKLIASLVSKMSEAQDKIDASSDAVDSATSGGRTGGRRGGGGDFG